MAEGSTIGDLLKKAGGVVSSAAEAYENPPPWLKLLIGAGLGTATSYGPPGLAARSGENYAAARGHARARQQLIDFAKSIGVEHPEMLPETTTPGDILPQYQQAKSGQFLRTRFGHEPEVMDIPGLKLPVPKPLVVGTVEERGRAATLYMKANGKAPESASDLLPFMDQAREELRQEKLAGPAATQAAITGRQRERGVVAAEQRTEAKLHALLNTYRTLKKGKAGQTYNIGGQTITTGAEAADPTALASVEQEIKNLIRDLPPQRRKQFLRALSVTKGKGAPTSKPLTADLAKQYLQKAGGDKDKARAMARADGYTF